ncbi:hypothetical protein F2P45_13545 [Massilia sp. CCM 8733]|uniref:Uncharacterized protein n=1 Tax=Massilia mucilaginosa TaxID=2609282 RepID=A0ABX0NTK4_9BURK|nr:hypothetical protein [Massilia mucilaginosa]NHZ90030.1 hypothetical protein [Massilia mucilaginosa]
MKRTAKYDFFNDAFPDDERVPYKLLRWRFLNRYYIYCHSKFNVVRQTCREWVPNEHESAFAQDDLDTAFELPIEKLMFEVLSMIMAGGRQSEQFNMHAEQRIREILHGRDVNDLLECLSGDELLEFRHDLALLNIA